MSDIEKIEKARLELQAKLDGHKTNEARNKLGQFATPTLLAREIVEHGKALLGEGTPIKFFDPGIGTGAFYSALSAITPLNDIVSSVGFEIDQHYSEPSQELWAKFPLNIRCQDFTKAIPHKSDLANLLICNPPYVRHHHLTGKSKAELQHLAEDACGIKLNGLSGLYCYFIALSHKWMLPGGVAGWLVPSEFMTVNYGRQIKEYLTTKVTLLQIHRYDPENVQFDDALVSSAVVWFRNEPPKQENEVLFSYGGTLGNPEISKMVPLNKLQADAKWTSYPQNTSGKPKAKMTLGDLFEIKRGLATGDNKFFIMGREKIEKLKLPIECFSPVLPSARYLPVDEIDADNNGWPLIDKQLFLLDVRLPEQEVSKKYPALKRYLDSGRVGEKPAASGYLCSKRRPWYLQENRPAAPILCTYMGRGAKGKRPFRFILNKSNATACNVYLMLYPRPALKQIMETNPSVLRDIWEYLNEVDANELLGHGRVYGGGLHKLEPKELRSFPVDALLARVPAIPLKAAMQKVA